MISIGVSLKAYFGQEQTRRWMEQVGAIAARHPAVRDGLVELFVLPSFPLLSATIETMAGTGVLVGAQDLHWDDSGAVTGGVGAALLTELGCVLAEVGHAERRRLFGETDEMVAAKVAAALRHGLTPVLCLGEPERGDAGRAAEQCVAQLGAVTAGVRESGLAGRLIIAYEPHWAIGAAEPAPREHIRSVCTALGAAVSDEPAFVGSTVIYGGSAGPGMLGDLWPAADGLFLGRFAHDPAALEAVLDEAVTVKEGSRERKTQTRIQGDPW